MHRRRVTVTLPAVIEDLSTARCLAMAFCEGESLKDASKLRAAGVDLTVLFARICEAWAVQMFADGIFNCGQPTRSYP